MKGFGTFRRAMTAVGAALAKPFKRLAEDVKNEKREIACAHEGKEDILEARAMRRSGRHRGYARQRVRGITLFWGKTVGRACPAPLSRKVLKRICPTHPLIAKGWR